MAIDLISLATADAVVASAGIGVIGSQLLDGWLGDRNGRRDIMLIEFWDRRRADLARAAETMPAIWAAAVGVGVGLMAGLFIQPGRPRRLISLQGSGSRPSDCFFWAANLGFSIVTNHGPGLGPTRVRPALLDQRDVLGRGVADRVVPGAGVASTAVENRPDARCRQCYCATG